MTSPRSSIPVYILAGGSSSRFGGDKARALVQGEPLLSRVAGELLPVAASLTVVADREGSYQGLGLRTIGDRRHGLGPLGGLHRALEDQAQRAHDAGDWLLLASCDLLGVRASWIEDLLCRLESRVQVVAFRQQRWEPMPALYRLDLLQQVAEQIEQGQQERRSACRTEPGEGIGITGKERGGSLSGISDRRATPPVVSRASLATGGRPLAALALWRLIERVEHVQVPYPKDWSQAVQINTPEDLERYLVQHA